MHHVHFVSHHSAMLSTCVLSDFPAGRAESLKNDCLKLLSAGVGHRGGGSRPSHFLPASSRRVREAQHAVPEHCCPLDTKLSMRGLLSRPSEALEQNVNVRTVAAKKCVRRNHGSGTLREDLQWCLRRCARGPVLESGLRSNRVSGSS